MAVMGQRPWTYVQAGLTAEQVDELAAFLLDGSPQGRRAQDGSEPVIEFNDHDNYGMSTRAAWTKQGRRMLVSVLSVVPLDAAPNEVELDGDQAHSLGGYLPEELRLRGSRARRSPSREVSIEPGEIGTR